MPEETGTQTCQHCGSKRVLSIVARSKDMTHYSMGGREYQGYPVDFSNNDNVEIDICFNCGKVADRDFPQVSEFEIMHDDLEQELDT